MPLALRLREESLSASIRTSTERRIQAKRNGFAQKQSCGVIYTRSWSHWETRGTSACICVAHRAPQCLITARLDVHTCMLMCTRLQKYKFRVSFKQMTVISEILSGHNQINCQSVYKVLKVLLVVRGPGPLLSLHVFIFSDGFVISLGMRDSLSLLARRQGWGLLDTDNIFSSVCLSYD